MEGNNSTQSQSTYHDQLRTYSCDYVIYSTSEPVLKQRRRYSPVNNTGIMSHILSTAMISHLVHPDIVRLVIDSAVVGYANLHKLADETGLSRLLYGTHLSSVVRGCEHFVVITKTTIHSFSATFPYPYTSPGQEGALESLGDVYPACHYAWDAFKLVTSGKPRSVYNGRKIRVAVPLQ